MAYVVELDTSLIGKVLFDEEDAERLHWHKWSLHTDGYAVASYYAGFKPNCPHRIIRMSRVIMEAPRNMEVDHINGNKLDNRKCNLRLCTSSQNKINRVFSKKNKAGCNGVFWDESRRRWLAFININKKRKHLGRFKLKSEAISARKSAETDEYQTFTRRK